MRHREQVRPLAERFGKNSTFTFLRIGQQDAAVLGTTKLPDIRNHFLERLFDIARTAQLDASLQHIGSCLRRKVRHRRRIRLRGHIVAVQAVANIFAIGFQRQKEHIQPQPHHVEIDVGMKRLAFVNAMVAVVLEILVFRETHFVWTSRNKRVVRNSFDIGTMRLVTGNNADIPECSVRKHFDRNDAGLSPVVRQNIFKIHIAIPARIFS